MYSCTIKITEVANRKSGNRQDTEYPQEKILSIERNDRTNENCIPIRYKNDDDVRCDVRRYEATLQPVLIQPVIQSVKDCNTAEKRAVCGV